MRFGWSALALAAATLMAGSSLHAQAPAGTPAGANGICKDGTYSLAPKKSGACQGHKGVQTWYAPAPTGPVSAQVTAAPSTVKSVPAMPIPVPTANAKAMPAPTPATRPGPAVATSTPASPSRRSPSVSAASKTAAPGGGPGLVWVNTASNVYHCNGDDFYGKTKAGTYMSEADAKAKGARGARGQSCQGK